MLMHTRQVDVSWMPLGDDLVNVVTLEAEGNAQCLGNQLFLYALVTMSFHAQPHRTRTGYARAVHGVASACIGIRAGARGPYSVAIIIYSEHFMHS